MEGMVSFRSIQIHLFAVDGIDTIHNFHPNITFQNK